MEKKEIKLRKDLNDMVERIELKTIKSRYSERHACIVTLFNNEEVEFKDKDGLYDYLTALKKAGKNGVIKSKKLVEEFKNDSAIDEVSSETGTYVCVVYELEVDGKSRTFRMFVNRFVDLAIIDVYYDDFKSKQAEEKSKIQK